MHLVDFMSAAWILSYMEMLINKMFALYFSFVAYKVHCKIEQKHRSNWWVETSFLFCPLCGWFESIVMMWCWIDAQSFKMDIGLVAYFNWKCVTRKTIHTRLHTTTYLGKLSVIRFNRIELKHIHALLRTTGNSPHFSQLFCDTDSIRLCSKSDRIRVSFLLRFVSSIFHYVCYWSIWAIIWTKRFSNAFVEFYSIGMNGEVAICILWKECGSFGLGAIR